MKNISIISVATLIIAVLSGCNTAQINRYSGEAKPASEVSILHNDLSQGLEIWTVDGEELASGFTTWSGNKGVREIHLEPGEHYVIGVLRIDGKYAHYRVDHLFEKGKEYKVSFELEGEDKVRFFIAQIY